MALVEIRDVYKTFTRGAERIEVFTGLTLDVEQGSFTALMGPSGSGKSTLLNLIAGLDKPTSGSVRVNGAEVSAMTPAQLASWRSEHVGFVFQSFNLLPVLTAFQNVELPLLLTRLSKKDRDERIRIALGVVGLEDRMDHYPRQLSGGQEQRVAIARAIVADPDAGAARRAHGAARCQELAGSAGAAGAAQRRVREDDPDRDARPRGRQPRHAPVAPGEGDVRGAGEPGAMKFWSLLRANLGRHKRRTFLTIASVALALFLFASLRSVITTIGAAAQFGSARRLVTTNATGFVLPLPVSYANRLEAVPGVEKVTWANWFGGRYGDGKRFFATFAVDAKSYLEIYPEMSVPADQKEAFLRDKGGALIGVRLVNLFGWKVGQNVTLQGTIFPGDWTFTIRGVYTPTDPAINDDALMFHFDYLDERAGRPGNAGWYIMEIDKPDNAAQIAKTIDDQFRSSPAPTKTGTEQAFNASFATMWGNIGLLMNTIGLAVVFAILLVTANAMMMSAQRADARARGAQDDRLLRPAALRAGARGGGADHDHRRGAGPGRGQAPVPGHQLQCRRVPARIRRELGHDRDRWRDRAGADAGERDRAGDAGGAAAGGDGAEERGMKIPITYNLRSMRARPVSTALTALGIALVVAVFIGMLALANGFASALVRTGSDLNVLVLRKGADSEMSSSIDRETASILASVPQAARGGDGRALVSPEVYVVIALGRIEDTTGMANVVLRGVSEQAWQVRQNLKVVEGRRPRAGRTSFASAPSWSAASPTRRWGSRCISPAGPGRWCVTSRRAARRSSRRCGARTSR